MNSWSEALVKLKILSKVDKHLQKQSQDEKSRWIAIFEQMISKVFCLLRNNLSFRGTSGSETLYTPNNDLSRSRKIHLVMMEPLSRIFNKLTNVHYFGSRIQNMSNNYR